MLEDSFKNMHKEGKVDISDVKKFIGEGDNNQDGRIEKSELQKIIMKSFKVTEPIQRTNSSI